MAWRCAYCGQKGERTERCTRCNAPSPPTISYYSGASLVPPEPPRRTILPYYSDRSAHDERFILPYLDPSRDVSKPLVMLAEKPRISVAVMLPIFLGLAILLALWVLYRHV